MSEPIAAQRVDPIELTKSLCEIDSTTYYEGAVGDFLADYLAGQGWEVEKTPVPQPTDSATAGPRWNVYGGISGKNPDLVFSTHMDTVPP
jgi:acetylornithine deacetylase